MANDPLNIIVCDDDSRIIMQEKPVYLSDEKLKGIMLKTYEKALMDAEKPKFYNHYGIFFSIFTTLLLSLLTSSFQDIGQIKAETLTILAWCLCIGCLLVGILMLSISTHHKSKYNTNNRDKAINEIFQQHCS